MPVRGRRGIADAQRLHCPVGRMGEKRWWKRQELLWRRPWTDCHGEGEDDVASIPDGCRQCQVGGVRLFHLAQYQLHRLSNRLLERQRRGFNGPT